MPTPTVNLLHLRQRVLDSLQEALPHLASRTGNMAWAGRWPDHSPAARQRLAGRIQAWIAELHELAGEQLEEDPQTVHLIHGLDRLARELGGPADPIMVVDLLGNGLRDLLMLPLATLPERAGALVQRLRALPALIEEVRSHGREFSPWRGQRAASALVELAQWLGAGAEPWLEASDESLALLRREAPAAREHLLELAGWFASEGNPPADRLGAEAMAGLLKRETGRDPHPERLEKQLERERVRLLGQMEQQAQHLVKRFIGAGNSGGSPGRHLAAVLEQLALDTPNVEHWEAYQQRQLRELHMLLGRTRLVNEPGACPVVAPRTWQEPPGDWEGLPALGPFPGMLMCLDLAGLDTAAQQDFVKDRHTWAMQVLLAREALPGRLWLMQQWQSLRGAARLLNHAADADGWALLAPDLFTRHGWGQGEPRLKLMLFRERLRDQAVALADLRWHTGTVDEDGILAGLRQHGMMPGWLARLELERIQREPGRALLALEKSEALRQLESRWRKLWADQAKPGDSIDLLAACADLPIHWLRRHGENKAPAGREVLEPVSPLILIRRHNQDELVANLEEQLAALGRIQREDLEAGQEFDTQPAGASLVEEDADTESGTDFSALALLKDLPDPPRQAEPDEEEDAE
jgi:hypothetical protein